MFASLRYIQTNHPYALIEGQPDQNPHPSTNAATSTNGTAAKATADAEAATQTQNGDGNDSQEPVPDAPEVFQASLRELSRDLIMKEQQIEYLIGVLPGIGTSEADQNARIKSIEKELRDTEVERKAALRERDTMLDVLGQLGANCKRVY